VVSVCHVLPARALFVSLLVLDKGSSVRDCHANPVWIRQELVIHLVWVKVSSQSTDFVYHVLWEQQPVTPCRFQLVVSQGSSWTKEPSANSALWVKPPVVSPQLLPSVPQATTSPPTMYVLFVPSAPPKLALQPAYKEPVTSPPETPVTNVKPHLPQSAIMLVQPKDSIPPPSPPLYQVLLQSKTIAWPVMLDLPPVPRYWRPQCHLLYLPDVSQDTIWLPKESAPYVPQLPLETKSYATQDRCQSSVTLDIQ